MTAAWSGRIMPLTARDASALAALHAGLFDPSWDDASFTRLLSADTAVGLVATGRPNQIDGALVAHVVAGEAEILTLMVDAARQRRGIGRLLLTALEARVATAGAERILLEVAAHNHAALALYRSSGFVAIGQRAGYYARANATAETAIVMAKPVGASRVATVGAEEDGA